LTRCYCLTSMPSMKRTQNSHGSAFDALPVKLEVRRYQHETSDHGKTMRDLSDHYGVAAEFSLWRNN